MGIWLVLQERLETLCWRVFLRKMSSPLNTTYSDSRFLYTYLPLRAKNPQTHTSVSLEIVAAVANKFLPQPDWDADDVVGVCINLIDQVIPP